MHASSERQVAGDGTGITCFRYSFSAGNVG